MAESDASASVAPGRARAILLAIAAGYAAFGLAFLLFPAKLASYLQLDATSHVALIELRAFYGGIELGLATFLAIAAARRPWHAAGLLAALLSLLGVAAARVYAISVEGSASFLIYALLAIEVAGVLGVAWGLVDTRRGATGPDSVKGLGADESKFEKLEKKEKLELEKKERLEKTLPVAGEKALERTVRLEKK